MQPAAVIYARGDDDVRACIEYAAANKIAIAVRTGGHQYSGASSTSGRNLLLDVSQVKDYQSNVWDSDAGILTAGVNQALLNLDSYMARYGIFVPHGQCAHVHVGGHAQSGGYGSPARAFGLFADHIEEIRLFTADGKVRWYSRHAVDQDEADVFYAVLGGGPGCFGVLTHIKLRPHLDEDHKKACGLELISPYNKDTLRKLLKIKADMAADRHPNPEVDAPLPADYDMTVTVLADAGYAGFWKDPMANRGGGLPKEDSMLVKTGFKKLQKKQRTTPGKAVQLLATYIPQPFIRLANWVGENIFGLEPFGNFLEGNVIIVWASWSNLGGADQDNADAIKWLNSIKDCGRWLLQNEDLEQPTAMSEMRQSFVFPIYREFKMPFDKRAYLTSATNLDTSGWIDMTIRQIDDMVHNRYRKCSCVVQIIALGGCESRLWLLDPDNKTSYSWRRDTTLVHVMDCFYYTPPKSSPQDKQTHRRHHVDSSSRHVAAAWQALNDIAFKDPELGVFSPGQDRRYLWGSHHARPSEKHMSLAWPLYHDSGAKYERLCAIKRRVDPDGVFTPNKFSDLLGTLADEEGEADRAFLGRPGAPKWGEAEA